jgi:hypothetical protein
MRALLDNKFAPVTFTCGFIASPFAQLSMAFIEWQRELDGKFGTQTEFKSFRGGLSDNLLALEPLTTPQNRYLLTETHSGWSAIFSNGLRVNDLFSPVSYLSSTLKCEGISVTCIPDRSSRAGTDEIQIYGAVKFILYGPNKTDWQNRIRSVSAANDVTGWRFATEGQVQPYEQTENYGKRRIVDRFTPEMLEFYCAALGIELFNADFYGERSLLAHTRNESPLGPTMTIAEARSYVHT